jgi:transcriptional regulator with XRE-family HTH domain
VRRARLAAGLSLAALGEAAGLSDSTLSSLERGEVDPKLSTCTRLAAALGLPLERLLGSWTKAGNEA